MTTRNYQEYLIESLKNRSRAALYIWAILQAENPEPELLVSALQDVTEALGEANLSEEEAKRHLEKLNELKDKQGSEAIHGLSDWLNELKLTLAVIDEQQYNINNIFTDLALMRDRLKKPLFENILSVLYFLHIDKTLIEAGKEVEIELEEANIISTKYSKKQLEFARKKKSNL